MYYDIAPSGFFVWKEQVFVPRNEGDVIPLQNEALTITKSGVVQEGRNRNIRTNNVGNLFKFNNKDVRTKPLTSLWCLYW